MASVTIRPYEKSDRDWVSSENIKHYMQIEQFSSGIGDDIQNALDLIEEQCDDSGSCYRIAELGDVPIGCIFLRPISPESGKIHLFFLNTAHRGKGLGRKMLQDCVNEARRAGLSRICVSTFDKHESACGLYRRFGFRLVDQTPTVMYGHPMNLMAFELDIA